MRAFQLFLGVFCISLIVYTGVVIANHGWNLLPIFFGDMMAMTWPGQFNFDFLGCLLLSGLWVSWRHHFTATGLALGAVAVFGGMLFLSGYLLVASRMAKGDVRVLLLGGTRARA